MLSVLSDPPKALVGHRGQHRRSAVGNSWQAFKVKPRKGHDSFLVVVFYFLIYFNWSIIAFPGGPGVKNLPANAEERWVRSLGGEDPLEKEMATYSSVLAWEIPWTERPGGLPSTGLQRVGRDLNNSSSTCFTML